MRGWQRLGGAHRRSWLIFVAGIALCVQLRADGATAEAGPSPEAVAQRCGLGAFPGIEELRYTFHVRKGEQEIARSWTWHPQTGHVLYQGPNSEGQSTNLVINEREIGPDHPPFERQVHQWFINDQYWLLFPLHLAWDSTAAVAVDGEADVPVVGGHATRITVTYPPTGGYTPGDVYELFVGDDLLIHGWIYRRGGAPQPTLETSWEDYEDFGPLTVSTLHRNADGSFRLWFTDIQVTMSGQ